MEKENQNRKVLLCRIEKNEPQSSTFLIEQHIIDWNGYVNLK